MKLLDRLLEHLAPRDRLVVHDRLVTDKDGRPADLELEAATAVLLLEAAYGDSEYVWREHETILKALEQSFGIDKEEALRLLGRADEIRPPVVELADVTEVIQQRLDEDQRMEVVSLIWRVVDADRIVDEWEELFANHVARAVGLTPEQASIARARSRH